MMKMKKACYYGPTDVIEEKVAKQIYLAKNVACDIYIISCCIKYYI